MVRSRRSISKEDASSLLADSGVSLSSPPAATNVRSATSKLKSDPDLDEILDFDENEVHNNNNDDNNENDAVHEIVIEVINESENVEIEKDILPKHRGKRRRGLAAKPTATATEEHSSSTKRLRKSSATSAAGKKSLKTYICSVCNKEFGGKSDLQRHTLIHSNERPYKCEQCNKTYRQAVNLKNHITTAHENRKQFKCEHCPKAFALKERLRLHMRLHSGDKPYACSLCDKRFARGGQLSQHILTNHPTDSRLKQFNCDFCSSAFTTAANLRAHKQRHEQGLDHTCDLCAEHFMDDVTLRQHQHKVHSNNKDFKCQICNETIKEDEASAHMKTHAQPKTHICEVCQAYFTKKSQYNVHMRMHTGERPYQCRICWQSFAHTSVLKLHIRKHTGEKPFQCLLCKDDEVYFSQLAHLKTHMRKIHKQENAYSCSGCGDFFKIKAQLQLHMEQCSRCDVNNASMNTQQQEQQTLTNLRFNIALLLKKISTEQKLQQLGYEKRLIDNVVVAALKLAARKAYDDHKLSEIERMRLNVEEFLNWIVPAKVMEGFQQQKLSVECILDKIVTFYMKQK